MAESNESGDGRAWLIAIAFVLLFPVVGFAVGTAVEAKIQGELDTAVEEDIGRTLTDDEKATLVVADVCAEPGAPAIRPAETWRRQRSLASSPSSPRSSACSCSGSSRSRRPGARRDRDALLRLFVPGLYIVLVAIRGAGRPRWRARIHVGLSRPRRAGRPHLSDRPARHRLRSRARSRRRAPGDPRDTPPGDLVGHRSPRRCHCGTRSPRDDRRDRRSCRHHPARSRPRRPRPRVLRDRGRYRGARRQVDGPQRLPVAATDAGS